jgi:hypothetical protein
MSADTGVVRFVLAALMVKMKESKSQVSEDTYRS